MGAVGQPMELSRAATVIGWGESYASDESPKTPLRLATEAAREALDRSGIQKDEIEGILTGRAPIADQRPQYNNILSSQWNLTPQLSTEITFHSAGVVSLFKYAAMAVATEVADPVLCVQSDAVPLYANGGERVTEMDVDPVFEYPYGPTIPAIFALIARRQMTEYGVTREHFAQVPVTAREWGREHPHAALGHKGEMTVEDVLAAPMVADPLSLFDCTPWGPPGTGGAFIVTKADAAASFTGTPIDIRGVGECSTHENISFRPSVRTAPVDHPGRLTATGAQVSGRTAFAMAECEPSEIDVAEITYLFSNIALLLLEDLGFCAKGDGGEFVANGGIDPETGLAFGTHGGDLTFGQPGVSFEMNAIIECLRQLAGEPLGRAVPDAELGLVHGIGSTCACHSTAILQRGG